MADAIRVVVNFDHLPRLIETMPREVERRIEALAQLGRNHAVELIHTITFGRYETRYRPLRQVIVSRPGDAPNTDTGTLAGSITVRSSGLFSREIAVGAEYGAYLEFGASPGLAPRPFMGPTAIHVEGLVTEVFHGLLGDLS